MTPACAETGVHMRLVEVRIATSLEKINICITIAVKNIQAFDLTIPCWKYMF